MKDSIFVIVMVSMYFFLQLKRQKELSESKERLESVSKELVTVTEEKTILKVLTQLHR